jgi:predicted lysophospholipase L1 biosynthesis ABC-type transport system permease subunit
VADHLRAQPGVESVALAGWALLTGSNAWNGFVSVNGAPPGPVLAYFLSVSPDWRNTMKIALLDGTDLRRSDTSPGAALVNETFVRQFFQGESPLGKQFAKGRDKYRVVGVVRDSPYRHIREPILPVAYVPFHSLNNAGEERPVRTATFVIRTTGANPLALAASLRREVPNARPEFRVSNIRTQAELMLAQTVRERLLAMLAMFFAGVALLLAGIGLYGVLDYSVIQRRREIGIRIAIGAQPTDIARRIIGDVFPVVFGGSVLGLLLGVGSVRYLQTLLYQVNATDPGMLAMPWVIVFVAAILAALPSVVRAIRINPIANLRAD